YRHGPAAGPANVSLLSGPRNGGALCWLLDDLWRGGRLPDGLSATRFALSHEHLITYGPHVAIYQLHHRSLSAVAQRRSSHAVDPAGRHLGVRAALRSVFASALSNLPRYPAQYV